MNIKYLFFFIILFQIGCNFAKDKPRRTKGIVIPTSESKLIKINSYDNYGNIKTIITGQRNVIFRDSKEILVDKIRILHILKEKGKDVFVQLMADNGKVNYKSLDCEAWGNAVIVRDKEVRIETEMVFWNHKEKIFRSHKDDKVIIFKKVHPDDPNDKSMIKTIGKNLIVDNSLKNIKTVELDETVSATPQSLTKDK